MSKPLVLTLAVTLTALVLERTLRLVDLVSSQSGSIDMVFSLAFYLLPHYVGLALPAAFFIALFATFARLDGDNELSAIGSVGLSPSQIVRPLVFTGAILACVSIVLFGYVQPYSRYLYREIRHVVSYTGWDMRLAQGVFFSPDESLAIHAGSVDATGRRIDEVFLVRRNTSSEVVIVADQGILRANEQKTRLQLVLQNGTQTIFSDENRAMSVAFSEYALAWDYPLDAPPFRLRGEDDRELTLTELYEVSTDATYPSDMQLASGAELHARIVRAISLPILPLLAMATAVAARRSGRGAGMVVGGVVLVLFHHTLQLGESLVDNGSLPIFTGLWAPFLIFVLFSIWVFHRTNLGQGEGPLSALFALVDWALKPLVRLVRRWHKSPA